MKRARETESPQTEDKSYRRQLPVSCLFCRSKKLKCDREQPCSNCVARNIECQSAVSGKVVYNSDRTGNGIVPRPKTTQNEDVFARLERLEQAVFRGRQHIESDSNEGYASAIGSLENMLHTPTGWQSVAGAPPTRTREYLNQAAHQHSPQNAETSPIQRNSSTKDPGSPGVSVPATPAVQDLSQLMLRTSKYESFLLGTPQPEDSSKNPIGPSFLSSYELSIILPTEQFAEVLFSHFVGNISWVYHIVHGPTTRNDMRNIYQMISNNTSYVKPQKLSLVAAILAIAAHLWVENPAHYLSVEDAKTMSKNCRQLAEKSMAEAKHDIDPTIETLQSSILMSQFLPTGITTHKRAMLASTLNSARILGLHQTDSKRNCRNRMNTEHSLAELEVRRRVWWHIACTDWMLSYMSGPQEGTYLCHPNQMNVLLPSNADDEDITPTSIKAVDFIGPNTAPTEMTYTITKVWFSEIVRSFVDTACASGLEVDELEYDQVITLDEQASRAIRELPYYFQLDEPSRKRSVEIDKQRPYIAWQREMIHFGFHTRLSRLHRPFMTRGYKDPKYAYSRMICLRSARVVIELEKTMRETGNKMHQQTTSRLWIIVHHVFMATVTLVMDYCCHRDDPRAAERRAEILECYKILERSQEESQIARNGLAHLRQVMNDWRAESSSDWQNDKAHSNNNNITTTTGSTYPTTAETFAQQSQNQSQNQNFSTSSTAPNQSTYASQISAQLQQQQPPQNDLIPTLQYWSGTNPNSGIDLAQDLWMMDDINNNGGGAPFAANFDPQWDALFNVLENQPGIYGMGV